jgi:hypothetical protein
MYSQLGFAIFKIIFGQLSYLRVLSTMRLKTVLLALIIAVQGDAQKLLNPDICIGPLSSAPSCNFYEHKLQVCDNLQGSAAAKCYCPQTVLNAIAG